MIQKIKVKQKRKNTMSRPFAGKTEMICGTYNGQKVCAAVTKGEKGIVTEFCKITDGIQGTPFKKPGFDCKGFISKMAKDGRVGESDFTWHQMKPLMQFVNAAKPQFQDTWEMAAGFGGTVATQMSKESDYNV